MCCYLLVCCGQGTDRWQSSELFDPSDAGAAGFYALNAHNSWWVVLLEQCAAGHHSCNGSQQHHHHSLCLVNLLLLVALMLTDAPGAPLQQHVTARLVH
jgi:hypothetical protein